MSQTVVSTSDALAVKAFSAALFATSQRQPSWMKNMTGAAPQQSEAEAKVKGQTSPGMPVVRVTDLSKGDGDKVTIDLINITGGKPIMGDRNAEGKGEKLSFSSMEVSIDLATKVIDSGGRMTQQRTKHNLRKLCLAQLAGYMPRFESQQCLVHAAGARGSQAGMDWVVPLQSDTDFAEIMINTVRAPTYNRHYVANSTNLTQGGLQLGSIASTDVLKLEHIDAISAIIGDAEVKPQPVKIADDPAAEDEPIKGILWVTERQWNSILANTTGQVWRTFLQNAWNRKSHGSKHPLFSGEPGMWNGVLVRKLERAIRFLPSESTKVVLVADRYTASESNQTVNAGLGAGYAVDRAILMGAQAIANVYGRSQSTDYYYGWSENWYNFKRNLEVAGEVMGGKAKVRFSVPDGNGNTEPTDHGIFVIDAAVKL